jgi:hypothetical protein
LEFGSCPFDPLIQRFQLGKQEQRNPNKTEILFLSSYVPDSYCSQQKAMRGKRMAEKLPVRLAPPFGGITRIRFKGFVSPTSQPSGSPALSLTLK